MSRWLSPLMAFCLSFMLISTFAPIVGITTDRQIDFWALWLGTVFILALPFIYLEFALVKRAKTTALNALMSLTREADASMQWRIAGWLSVIFMPFLAGGMLANISHIGLQLIPTSLPENIIFAGLAVFAFILSFIPRQILSILSIIGVISSLVISQVFGTHLPAWHMTSVTFVEWGNATLLALVAGGLGLGIYAQSSVNSLNSTDKATPLVMPIWLAQVLAVIAFGVFAAQTQISEMSLLVTVLFGAALLIQLAKEQLQQRQVSIVLQYVLLLVPLFVWAVTLLMPVLNAVMMLWGLVSCLMYAIFVGWIMKISHLRKALNFSSEVFYNIWRIAIRVIAPLSIILALVAVIMGRF
ncbi:hypothetical protein [Acinetobacter nectaris]|uniref:hypothetical protein n=1 Tax=Acinetobacter nectaris TaxID=1219382 RepID=UPI001F29BD26|nr:hypothetical protein [Acinetobacter nectaris]MCF8999952.1 hypothetical protein [Acinetobacter nectaris]MCF9026776.1 hypothetical protein [Acinetobacter nectaris]